MRIESKVSKHALWLGLLAIGLPLLGINAGVWSRVTHSDDRYMSRQEMEQHVKDIIGCKEMMNRLPDELKDLKQEINGLRQEMDSRQRENTRDIKEILRHLRDR